MNGLDKRVEWGEVPYNKGLTLKNRLLMLPAPMPKSLFS